MNATIPYVVASCIGTGGGVSCTNAEIGSVDSSCNGNASCNLAELNGVDLIDSCNEFLACRDTDSDREITELNDCCNDAAFQCEGKAGFDIVTDGCVSYCPLHLLLLISTSLLCFRFLFIFVK